MNSFERRVLLWSFVVMSAVFLLFQEGAVTGYDGQTVFEVTRSLVERRTFAISDEFNTLPGADGRHYSRYGLGLSLVGAIPYLAVRPIALASSQGNYLLEASVASSMAFITAGLIVSLYLLARRIGADPAAALFAGIGAVMGTFVMPYTKEFFAEPLTALCVVVTIERLLRRRATTAGFALGAAVLVRAQTLLFSPVVLVVAWLQDGVRGLLRVAMGFAPGLAVTAAYNVARFGHPLQFGYEDVGFTTPVLTGVTGLLFEPTKSVLLFAPIVVLLPFALYRLWRQDRLASLLIAANLTITLAIVVPWFAWHGGWCWGPRLIIPGLVPAFAAVGPWLRNQARWRAAGLLFALGFAVSLPAMIVPIQAQQLERPRVPHAVLRQGHFMATQPLASPSPRRQFELVLPVTRYTFDHLYGGLDDGRNYLRYLSLWQVGLMRRLQHTGAIGSFVLSTLLILVVVTGTRRLRAAVSELVRRDPGSFQSVSTN